jgi:hypothetical protein
LHYDVQVEQDQPHDQDPEDDGEVEEQGGGPEQQAQPQNPYATYEDVYMLGGAIDNLSINLRDTTQDMTSSFGHWSNQWNYSPLQ